MVMPWSEEKATLSTHSDKRRIAVLPFANISPDSKDEYFADGMTEELISTISNMSELSVISRTSVMGYKGTSKKIREIGQELEVGSSAGGEREKGREQDAVTVQLISVVNDKHLWAQSYDRELDDVFAVQSDIAKRVAEALRITILPGEEEKRIEKRPTKDIEAYALYLKGRSQWNKRSDEGLRSAIEFFQKAIADRRRLRAGLLRGGGFVRGPCHQRSHPKDGGAPESQEIRQSRPWKSMTAWRRRTSLSPWRSRHTIGIGQGRRGSSGGRLKSTQAMRRLITGTRCCFSFSGGSTRLSRRYTGLRNWTPSPW